MQQAILLPPENLENYEKGEVKDINNKELNLVFHPTCIHMKVSNGSKIKNLMGFAIPKIKDEKIRQISWNGSGQAITKVLSCAEIMKRKVKDLHQISDVHKKRVEEYWEPKVEGLERLKVNKDYPAITILLSKDPLDTTHASYQAPGVSDGFWKKSSSASGHRREKRPRQQPQPHAMVQLENKKKPNKKFRPDGGKDGQRERWQKGQDKGQKGQDGQEKGQRGQDKGQGKGQRGQEKGQKGQDKGQRGQDKEQKGQDKGKNKEDVEGNGQTTMETNA